MLKKGRADVLSTRNERLVSMGAARLPDNFTHVFEHRNSSLSIGVDDWRLAAALIRNSIG